MIEVIRHQETPFLIASYGPKRTMWKACTYCTTEYQIYPLTEFNNSLICTNCSHNFKTNFVAVSNVIHIAEEGQPIACKKLTNPKETKPNDIKEICKRCLRKYRKQHNEDPVL